MKTIDHRNGGVDAENVIVPWITIESSEDTVFLEELAEEILIMSKTHNTNHVVILPFAHLSNVHCKRRIAYDILQKLVKVLEEKSFTVDMVHFGSYKDTEFLSESHPDQVKFRTYPKPDYASSDY
jgi:hypothetical protein